MTEIPNQIRERQHQEAVAWHVRLTSGALSADAAAEFKHWRQQSPDNEQAYRDIAKLWQQLPGPLQADRQRRRKLAAKRRYRHLNRRGLGLAAAASLLLAVVVDFYPDYLRNPWADYRTHIGEQASIKLADGSVAYLNTDTAIDVSIGDKVRRVQLLRGEAEFDVARDSNRPFRVAAGATTTEALGTRFIVRYDGNGGAVTLLQGKVRTSRLAPDGTETDSATLHAGQQIAFNAGQLGAVRPVELNTADAWRRGRLLMNFVTLKQVITELNRYRRSRIRLLDDRLAEREVNIAIDINHVDAWLEALQQTMPIRIIKAGPFVFLQS